MWEQDSDTSHFSLSVAVSMEWGVGVECIREQRESQKIREARGEVLLMEQNTASDSGG